MVVCKFFLQGTCKFGDFCKFEHQLNDFSSYQNSTSILRQSHFGAPQQTKPNNPSTIDTGTLVKSVVNDMTTAEKGGQWLLSCYAPFKEKPAFPGFEDQSFEEVRLGYYEAVKNGTVEQYKQQVQVMLQQAIMKLKSLQSPSPDIVNLLKSIYNTPPSSSCGVFGTNTTTTSNVFANTPNTQINFGQQQQTTFGQQSGSSMFAQANQNIFSKPPQSQNSFAGTSSNIFGGAPQNVNTFGGPTNNSPFASNQAQPQGTNSNIFGQANTNFAGQGTGSIFGGQQSAMQTSTGSIFGGALPSNNMSGTSSVFAAQNTSMPFGAQPQVQIGGSNIFANQSHKPFEETNAFTLQTNSTTFVQPSQSATNIFASPPNIQSNPVFGAPTTNPNMPQQTSTNIFGGASNQPQNHMFTTHTEAPIFTHQGGVNSVIGQQNTNSPFGQPIKSAVDAQSHSSSIFGNSQQVGSSNQTFGQVQQPQQIDESVYSKLEDLTEEEIKWFESDDLDIMNIPDNPPAYQMCFKT